MNFGWHGEHTIWLTSDLCTVPGINSTEGTARRKGLDGIIGLASLDDHCVGIGYMGVILLVENVAM